MRNWMPVTLRYKVRIKKLGFSLSLSLSFLMILRQQSNETKHLHVKSIKYDTIQIIHSLPKVLKGLTHQGMVVQESLKCHIPRLPE